MPAGARADHRQPDRTQLDVCHRPVPVLRARSGVAHRITDVMRWCRRSAFIGSNRKHLRDCEITLAIGDHANHRRDIG